MWARCLLLLLLSFTLGAAAGKTPPLPQIRTGTRDKPLWIAEADWYTGSILSSDAFVVGEVVDVSSDIQTTPQQTTLSETCDLVVNRVFGRMDDIAGIKLARLTKTVVASPYVPTEPGWRRLSQLKKGQQVLVLLHEYEGNPCFGSEGLVELTDSTRTLPTILQRTAFQAMEFTDADLQVLKAASRPLHAEVADFRSQLSSAKGPENERELPMMAVLAVSSGALMVGVGWLVRRRLKR